MKFPINPINKKKRESTHPTEPQRAERLAELGSQLRQRREQQELSLEEVVLRTKISRRLLQAIEEGNLNELPEPIYIQGLIRQFADALGFNGVEFASSFPTTSSRLNLKPAWKCLPGGQLRPFHLYLVYVVLIVCSVNSLSNTLRRSELVNVQNNPASPIAPSSKSQQDVANQPQQIQPVSNDSAKQAVKIGVTLKQQSWIKVVADGKTQFEGVLPEGTQRAWEAQEQLTVRAGNAGGVLMTVNHQQAKQMGNPGEVEEVTVAANPKF